jgi:hypothetical protein
MRREWSQGQYRGRDNDEGDAFRYSKLDSAL